MDYQIFINNQELATGKVFNLATILIILIALLVISIIYFIGRLKENHRLKYEFVTIIAHKFRTPLTYIKWVCDSLVTDETDSFKKKSLKDIQESNQKLINLTGTLIELTDSGKSGTASYHIEKLNLCEVVKKLAAEMRYSIQEKNIFFSVNCNDENINIKADRTRLEFILSTILDNARLYTPIGRSIDVNISGSFLKATITIKDTGIGISKEDLPYVFSNFFRGHNARQTDTEGVGVGLYMAKSIVKRLGGKITVYSAGQDQGSTFTITLPRTK